MTSTNRFTIIEHNCITDFVLNQAANIKITTEFQQSNHFLLKEADFNKQNMAERKVVDDMLTAVALSVGGVKDECWKQKNSVNQFYHNCTSSFHFYLFEDD